MFIVNTLRTIISVVYLSCVRLVFFFPGAVVVSICYFYGRNLVLEVGFGYVAPGRRRWTRLANIGGQRDELRHGFAVEHEACVVYMPVGRQSATSDVGWCIPNTSYCCIVYYDILLLNTWYMIRELLRTSKWIVHHGVNYVAPDATTSTCRTQ